MTQTTTDYLQIARQLPCPTVGQTERFVRFVAEAHSWYKHLPIMPKVPFVFFLDPGAGMSMVQTRTGETALLPITDETSRFHYTWQTTEDYRRRFGHWNYHAPYGPRVLLMEKGGLTDTHGKRQTVLTDTGDWVEVPGDLMAMGTAHVSALIHSMPNFGIWARDPQRFGLTGIESARAGDAFYDALLVLLERIPPTPSVDVCVASISSDLLKALTAVPGGRFFNRNAAASWDWPEDEWLQQRCADGVPAELLPMVVKYVDVHFHQVMIGKFFAKQTGVDVLAMLTEERGRDLMAMSAAMYRFADAVYS